MRENDLMAKLMKSKQIMDAVENSKFVKNSDGTMTKVSTNQHPMQQYQQPQQHYPMVNEQYVDPNAPSGATKLPKEILEAMMNNPIPTFDEIKKLNDPFEQAAKAMGEQRKNSYIVEQRSNPFPQQNNDMITISKSELKSMIYESMLEILPKMISNIEETTIRKTVQLIIKENKEKKGRL